MRSYLSVRSVTQPPAIYTTTWWCRWVKCNYLVVGQVKYNRMVLGQVKYDRMVVGQVKLGSLVVQVRGYCAPPHQGYCAPPSYGISPRLPCDTTLQTDLKMPKRHLYGVLADPVRLECTQKVSNTPGGFLVGPSQRSQLCRNSSGGAHLAHLALKPCHAIV